MIVYLFYNYFIVFMNYFPVCFTIILAAYKLNSITLSYLDTNIPAFILYSSYRLSNTYQMNLFLGRICEVL